MYVYTLVLYLVIRENRIKFVKSKNPQNENKRCNPQKSKKSFVKSKQTNSTNKLQNKGKNSAVSPRLFRTSHNSSRTLKHVPNSVITVLFVVLVSLFAGLFNTYTRVHVSAAPNNTINYQARILQSSGAVVPDGAYNVEFKIYDSASAGSSAQGSCSLNSSSDDCWWLETRTGANKVVVKNGYITVALGSVTAFGSSIPWDQQLWVTMNIGGTGSPTWDGEMTPRMQVTAVPYAYSAAKLQTTSGANTSTLSILAPTGGNQVFQLQDQGAAGTYNICIQNSSSCGFVTGTSANFIQNQNAIQQSASNFWLSGTGRADTALNAPIFDTATGVALTIGATNATSVTVGKSGANTTIGGALIVSQATTLNGNVTISGSNTLTVNTGATTLGGSLSVAGATTLNGTQLTNNGSTRFGTLAVADDSDGGSLGGTPGTPLTAAQSVDIYTSFNVTQTTFGQAITLPAPTSTTPGRIVFVSNTGTQTFTMYGFNVDPGGNGSFVWNGTSWSIIGNNGGSGAYIQNQNAVQQATSNFWISGTGRLDGGIIAPSVQSANQTAASTNSANVSIKSGNASGVTSNSGSVTIDSGTATGTTGNINLGTVNAGTVNISKTGGATAIAGSLTVGQSSTFNGNITQSGSNSFSTGTGAVSLQGAVTAGSTLTTTGLGTFNGGLTVATGYTFTNGGSTLNTAIALGDLAAGPLGTSGSTVDVATSFTINPSASGRTYTIPSPTVGTAGRLIYISNISANSFIIGGNTIGAGNNVAYVWNGTAWAPTGVTGVTTVGAIDTQAKSANGVVINGANIYLQTADATNVGLVSTTTQTFAGAKTFSSLLTASAGLTIAAGQQFTNNGATLNTVLAVADDSDGGPLGGTPGSPLTAAQSVDIYTAITINQTTAGQTITLPSPTNTAAGRVIYISNIGTQTITMSGFTIAPAGTAEFVWNGSAWTLNGNVGGSGNFIQNQSSVQQPTSSFWISGTGRSDTSLTTPLIDTPTAVALNIGTNNATGVNLNQNTTVTGSKTFTVGTGLTSLGGGLSVTSGTTTLSGDLAANGNTTLGNATTDRLTVTSQILGGTPLVFQGATDNAFSTSFLFTDPTANNNITFPDASGTVCLTSGNCSTAGSGYVLNQSSTPGSAQTGNINMSGTIIGTTLQGTTNVLTPTLDAVSAGALNIGTTTATSINLNKNTNIAGNTLTFTNGGTNTITTSSTSAFQILGGTGTGAGTGGGLNIYGGTGGATGGGGGVAINGGGAGGGNATGGDVSISGGTGAGTGGGGILNLFGGWGGTTGAGNGGAVLLYGGDAGTGNSNGGDITISGGTKSGSGTSGQVIIKPRASNDRASFFQVQDAAGSSIVSIDTNVAALTLAGSFSQTGANTFGTGTGAVSLNGATSVTGTNTLTVGTGLTSLGGGLSVTAGTTTLSGDLLANGNTTLGNATTDRLTVTSQILGGSPLVFQGATDNAFTTTLTVTDPTANNTITFPDASGTVQLAPASGSYIKQTPTSTADNTISTTANAVALTVNGTTNGTASTALAVSQPGAAAGITIASANNTATNGLSFSGTFTNLINATNFTVSNAGAVTAVGVNSGTGLLQGTGGLTVTGTTSINASGANTTNIGTGTNSGAINVGNAGAGAIVVQSGTSIGLTGVTNINASANNDTNINTGTSTGIVTIGNNSTAANAVNIAAGSTGGINFNSSLLKRAAAGTTNFDLNDAANTTLAIVNNGTGVANLTVDGSITGVGVNAGAGLLQGSLGLTVSGAAANINVNSNFATNINTGTSTGAVTIGNNGTAANSVTLAAGSTGGINFNSSLLQRTAAGTTTFNLNDAADTTLAFTNTGTGVANLTVDGSITAVGVNAGAGLLQGSLGLTVSGAAASINNNSNFATNINTGTSTGAVTIGNGAAGAIALQSGTSIGLTGATTVTGAFTQTGTTLINTTGTAATTIGNSTGTLALLGGASTTLAVSNGANTTTLSFTAPTAARSIVFPDASGTVQLSPAGSGNALVQVPSSNTNGANGANIIIPTAASIVGLTVNGTTGTAATALAVSQPGAAAGITIASANNTATNGLSFSGTFTNLINSTNFNVTNAGAVTAVGVNSGTGLLQGTGGLTLTGTTSINASGASATSIATGTGNLTVGNATGTFQLTSNGGLNVSTTGALTGVTGITTSGGYTQSGTTANTLTGATNIAVTNANAFRVQSASGTDTMLNIDTTTGNAIKVGNNTGTGNATTVLVLDSATTSTGLPTTVGAMYYDTTAGRIQCYEGTSWGNCGNTTLQEAYTSSASSPTPEIIVDSTRRGLDIQDITGGTLGTTEGLLNVRGVATATTLGASLFVVQGNGRVGINNGSTGTAPAVSYDLSFGQIAGVTTARTIGVEAQGTAATGGNGLTVSSGAGNTTGAGGLLTLQSGAGGATGAGGALTVQGGNGGATSGAGGLVTIQGGNATAGASNGGGVSILAGASTTTGVAGAITVTAGAGVAGSNTAGGVINITSGAGGGSAAGGALTILGGQGGATGTGAGVTVRAGAGGATSGSGGLLTLQGGNATASAANGGNLNLVGGLGGATGVKGLVVLDTATFSTAGTQTSGVSVNITQANVDGFGAVLLTASASGITYTLQNPSLGAAAAGRLIYITNNGGTNDFTLSFNGGGTGNTIAMKTNTTATMIWSGSSWSAAGASSSTDLQAAYNNTLSSAGGAEIVLNNTASSNGFTIRNNLSSPIIGGGLLEVQSSIGTNLFSVNNNSSELVANGGAEDNSTFTTNWTALGTSTISRTTTAGQYVTGTAGVSVAAGTTANNGVRANLGTTPAVSTTYMVSFTAKLASGAPAFTDLAVAYTRNGGSPPAGADPSPILCVNGQTLSTTEWVRVTCEVTTPSTAASNADILIYQVAAPGSARTFYIDNLSMTLADNSGGIPNNVQIGGGINGGAPTLFTLDRSSAPPVANGNTTYYGSMYYDTTTGSIQCYEADGWGACGSPPANIITLTPEYPGAVLGDPGTVGGVTTPVGVGTMTAEFCSNQSGTIVVGTLCSAGEARNYYRWTSPQATDQTYSVYVTYKLPATFKEFNDSSTIKLTAYTTSTSLASAKLQVFRKNVALGTIVSCGAATTINSSASSWQQTPFGGDEMACGFAGSDYVIFKIDVMAKSGASVYIENLDFTFNNR